MHFHKNLKYLRQRRSITQKEMALMLGITERGYRNYELGQREPNLSDLIKIASFLEISLDDLVCRDLSSSSEAPADEH